MAIVLIFLGCFLLYSKSKHFPKQFAALAYRLQGKETVVRIASYGFFILSMASLIHQFGLASGLIIFLIVLMFGLCLIVMFLPLHKKYAYLLVGLGLLSIVIENSL
ncbi:MAG: hypothetical protein AAGB24_08050 [Bacteroidota bacterium]